MKNKLVHTIGVLVIVLLTFFPSISTHAAAVSTAPDVQSFRLVSPDEGWLLFDQHLYWTKTGGQTWTDITPSNPTQAIIRAVSFLDAKFGWVILSSSDQFGFSHFYLARTADGGKSWQSNSLSLFQPRDNRSITSAVYLQFLDSETGWMVIKQATSSNFSVGSLFKTIDGGKTWTQLSIPIGEPIYFVTSEIGWTAGGAAGDKLYQTRDGGLTWSSQSINLSAQGNNQRRLYQLPKFENAEHGLLPTVVSVGDKSQVEFYATSDGGQSWTHTTTVPLDREISAGAKVPLTILDPNTASTIIAGGKRIAKTKNDTATMTTSLDSAVTGIIELDMASESAGWAKSSSGNCTLTPPAGSNSLSTPQVSKKCVSETRLLRTIDGGQNWQAVALPNGSTFLSNETTNSPRLNSATRSLAPRGSTQTTTNPGFDTCAIPSISQLQDWWNNSPYYVLNFYMPSANQCFYSTPLSNSYLSQLSQQGWLFIPTWVGLQGPGNNCGCSTFSTDPTTAYNQGVSEANSAADAAANLGVGNTIIYKDLEAFGYTNSTYRTAAQSFISGWVAQLHARGFQAGVYGSAGASAIDYYYSISNRPDAIWPGGGGYWSSSYSASASVWGNAYISDSHWNNHQRIYQYTSGHTETWGSTSYSIDSDALDGIVAAYGGGGNPPSAPSNPNPGDGSTVDRTTDITFSWSTNGTSCDIHIWGGPSINTTQNGISCSSFHWGSQWPGSYQWQVTAHNSYGTTTGPTWSLKIKPYPPTNLNASTGSQTQINLSWTKSSDDPGSVDSYNVRYSNGTLITSLNAGSTSYPVNGLTCGTSYSFYVTAVRQGVESNASNTASASTSSCGQAPSTPSNPNPGDGSTVERTNNTTFYWSTNGTSCDIHIWGGPSINITQNGISCSSFFWGVQWPGAYQWQVTAHNSYGTTSGPTWHLNIKPYSPTNLSASTGSQTQINLGWTKSSDDPGSVDNYKVYYSNGTSITTLNSGTTNYTVGSLTCGIAYSFYVTAIRQGVESNASNTASASTQSCSQPTVSVTAVRTGDANWNSKLAFNPGDSIVYIGDVNNTTGSTQTAYFDWEINGPCGRISWWQGNLDTSSGTSSWGLPTSIPSNACGGTYTYQLSVTYNGSTTSKSTAFTVSSIVDPRQEGPVSITGSLVVGGRAYFTINIKNYGNTATPAIHPYIEGYANGSLFWRADGAQPGSAVIQPGQTVSFQDNYVLNVAGTWTANGIYLWNNDVGTYWKPLPANGQNQQFSFTVTNSNYIYLPFVRR
jgi:photosystem II stability/assembly factor-like uncharacterized protein